MLPMNAGLKIVAIFVGLGFLSPAPERVTEIPNLLWKRVFGSSDFDHEYQRAVLANNQLSIAVKMRPAWSQEKPWTSTIWEIDVKGEITSRVEIRMPEAPSQ